MIKCNLCGFYISSSSQLTSLFPFRADFFRSHTRNLLLLTLVEGVQLSVRGAVDEAELEGGVRSLALARLLAADRAAFARVLARTDVVRSARHDLQAANAFALALVIVLVLVLAAAGDVDVLTLAALVGVGAGEERGEGGGGTGENEGVGGKGRLREGRRGLLFRLASSVTSFERMLLAVGISVAAAVP